MEVSKFLIKNFSLKKPINWNCPTCDRGILNIDKKHFYFEETKSSKDEHSEIYWAPDFTIYLFHGLLRCNNCNEIVIIAGKGTVDHIQYQDQMTYEYIEEYNNVFTPLFINPPIKIINIPVNCPQNITKEITTSFSLYWHDLPSCANRIRSSIEKLMDKYKVNKTFLQSGKRKRLSLHKRIMEFKKEKPEIAELLLAIKWIGNSGSHVSQLENADLIKAYELLEHSLNKLFDSTEEKMQKISHEINRRKGTRRKKN